MREAGVLEVDARPAGQGHTEGAQQLACVFGHPQCKEDFLHSLLIHELQGIQTLGAATGDAGFSVKEAVQHTPEDAARFMLASSNLRCQLQVLATDGALQDAGLELLAKVLQSSPFGIALRGVRQVHHIGFHEAAECNRALAVRDAAEPTFHQTDGATGSVRRRTSSTPCRHSVNVCSKQAQLSAPKELPQQ